MKEERIHKKEPTKEEIEAVSIPKHIPLLGSKQVLSTKIIDLATKHYILERRRTYLYQDNHTGILNNSMTLLYALPSFARTPLVFLIL